MSCINEVLRSDGKFVKFQCSADRTKMAWVALRTLDALGNEERARTPEEALSILQSLKHCGRCPNRVEIKRKIDYRQLFIDYAIISIIAVILFNIVRSI